MSLVFRIFKGWKTDNLEDAWVNNYEFSTNIAPTNPMALSILNSLVEAEQALHLPNVRFINATISTWAPDSKPYNPNSFKSVPLAVNGTQYIGSGGQDAVDMNVCLMMRAHVNQGRAGRRLYRGCLQKGHVTATDDLKFKLVPGSPLSIGGTSIETFNTTISPWYQSGIAGGSTTWLAIIGQYGKTEFEPGTIIERPIVDFSPGGVVINKTNHKYFDRS